MIETKIPLTSKITLHGLIAPCVSDKSFVVFVWSQTPQMDISKTVNNCLFSVCHLDELRLKDKLCKIVLKDFYLKG